MNGLRIVREVLAAAALALPLGCAGQKQAYRPAEPLRLEGVSRAQVMQAAERTLGEMHFVIEKLDAGQGVIRTEPLRGAQAFEFWRSDNVGLHNTAEANLHTIRRSVELRIREEQGQVCVDCNVPVQRLSLPENKVASVSQAYQMHSASTATVQRLQLSPQQRRGMTWIDMDQDSPLATRILDLIAQKIGQSEDNWRK
jgi:hypothetical protein